MEREIKFRIAFTITVFKKKKKKKEDEEKKKKNLFTSKLDSNLRKKLVKCYIWRVDFYGAENWILRKV
jgi:hypothetical protein